ncbi:MAG: alpha/beta hydrolase [Clostridia bacterium]|nr:alpha/beta hydrolase [Clostridia bacterium]
MKKTIKFLIIILLFILVISFIGYLLLLNGADIIGFGKNKVVDYDRKANIWGNTVAGNSSKSKLDEMNIDYNQTNLLLSAYDFSRGMVNKEYEDAEQVMDTYTYLYEIKNGYEKETYEDEPYIIPYLVDNSDLAVIVICGGGFGYKSMDGATNEGKEIADTLNRNGFNAFVLHYRSNPYEYPIPYLDLQRAIRYIRFHSEDYHINKDKISLIGFSAGGNEIGTFINKIQGKDFFPENYIKDEIDLIDDKVNSAAMIYPLLSFRSNIPMLFCLFNDDDIRDEKKRNEILEMTDLYRNISSQDVKQFIAYGTNDNIVGMDEAKKYIEYVKNEGTDVTVVEAQNQDHCFSQEHYMNEYIEWLKNNI